MSGLSDLYENFTSLISQRFYTKTESEENINNTVQELILSLGYSINSDVTQPTEENTNDNDDGLDGYDTPL